MGSGDPAYSALSDLILAERSQSVDGLPKRIAALRPVLSRVAITPAGRTELVAAQAGLRALAGSNKLDHSEKDWLALIDVALAVPPPNRRGFFSRWRLT